MARETDLQKAIEEIKSSLKTKDLDSLKNQVLEKINQGNVNLSDLLNDESLQETLQILLKNKNIANLLQNPEITNQLNSLLHSNNSQNLIDQIQNFINNENLEKKN